MAVVKIIHVHALSHDEARKRLRDAFSAMPGSWGVKYRWDGDTVALKGSGFTADVRVNAASVEVEAKLGLAASVFKRKVESGIRTELEKLLKP